MNSIPRTSGIYQIACIPTSKMYIGSAVDLGQRWIDHRKTLRGNRHHNPYLQHAWNKYGESAFVFTVVEHVADKELLITREQAWLDRTRCYEEAIGFNICIMAGSNLGAAFSDKARQNISESRSSTWEGFIDPQGNPVTIVNLWQFCDEQGLNFRAMWSLARGYGKVRSYKGWTHKNNPPAEGWVYSPRQEGLKSYDGFIDPLGNPVGTIDNMRAFCEAHGLSDSKMRAVYFGRRKHHRGWTCHHSP